MPDLPERAGGRTASSSVAVRRRLLDVLGPLRPLTVVSAPAGYGKSTLVESWLAEPIRDTTVVRSALEEDDLLPEAFWPPLVQALRAVGVVPDRGEGAGGPGDGGHGRAKALAADISAHGRPVVWVLDCGEFSLSAEVGRDVDRLIRASAGSLATLVLTR